MGFIQVFSLEDKEELIKKGFNFMFEQKIGDKIVYVFECHKIKFSEEDLKGIKYRITNKMYF